MSVCPEILKCYCCLIRTGVCACVAHAVRIASMATATNGIGVGTVVWRRGNQHAVAINIDVG